MTPNAGMPVGKDRSQRAPYEYPPKGTPCQACDNKYREYELLTCECGRRICEDCVRTCDGCGECIGCKKCLDYDDILRIWTSGDECKEEWIRKSGGQNETIQRQAKR